MKRRALIALGLASASGLARSETGAEQPAAAPADGLAIKPYLQVPTVPGEEHMVRVYYSPSCEFSRMYFSFFKNLHATLPTNRRFELTPVVNKGDGIGYALAYMAVRAYYPAYVENFVEASLEGVQERGLATHNWRDILKIGNAAHVPKPVPALVHAHLAELEVMVTEATKLQSKLKITNTPSVAVAGTYIVTPEFTKGDPQMFSRLVNAVISMAS